MYSAKKRERTSKKSQNMEMKRAGFRLKPTGKVSKIALNRLSIPKEAPPKWYPPTSYSSDKETALKEAAYYIRNNKCQYVKVVKHRDEDGIMWGVSTYPEIVYRRYY